jgi:DNA-binding transcriptional MerR regulator
MRRTRDRDQLLLTSDVARLLNITSNGVRYLVHCGKLPAEFASRQRIFRLRDVERLARVRGVRGELEPPADTA